MVKQPVELIGYINGEFIPQTELRLSIQDAGWSGVSVFTSICTANKTKLFRLEDHLERLYSGLRMIELDPGISPKELRSILTDLAERNAPLLKPPVDEVLYSPNFTPGVPPVLHYMHQGFGTPGYKELSKKPTLFIWPIHINLKIYGYHYKYGIHVVVANTRFPPPQCLDMKIKTHNRLISYLGLLETRKIDQHYHWTLFMDIYGNILECMTANIFIAKKGKLITPPTRNILGGISRSVVLDLAEKLGLPTYERDIQLYDLFNADEAFITASTIRMFPISVVNGRTIWKDVPGPITKRLMDAYGEEIGYDFVTRSIKYLEDTELPIFPPQ